jgi:hypothetical protein
MRPVFCLFIHRTIGRRKRCSCSSGVDAVTVSPHRCHACREGAPWTEPGGMLVCSAPNASLLDAHCDAVRAGVL